MNMSQAQAAGDMERVSYFQKEAKKTPLGINAASPRDIMLYGYKALPESESRYLESFKQLKTTEQRARALRLASPTMGYLLTNYWQAQTPSGKFSDPFMEQKAQEFTPATFRQNVLTDLMASVQLPNRSWEGWDPKVNLNAARTKYIESIGEDIHNFGLWESDVRQYERQFPELPVPELLDIPSSPVVTFNENVARLGLTSQVLGYNFGYGGRNSQQIHYNYPRHHDIYASYYNHDYRITSSIYNYR